MAAGVDVEFKLPMVLFILKVSSPIARKATVKFHEIEMLTSGEMQRLVDRISERIARLLEREGYLERDSEAGSLLLDGFDDDVINHLQGSSITYRIAVGLQRGKKVFMLKMLLSMDDIEDTSGQTLAKGGGFSLHAGVVAKSHQRDKVERLCRYIARPAVSTHRLELERAQLRIEDPL